MSSSDAATTVQQAARDIETSLLERGYPSASAGIVVDGALVWSRGFGFADPERRVPTTPRTPFRIASITKVFTALAVLQLRDRGALTLHDRLGHWLPGAAQVAYPSVDARRLELIDLLTHSSGSRMY